MAAAAGRRRRTSIGGYNLLYKIGAGGMSEVWRAEKVGPGGAIKPGVIKIILPHLSDSEKRIQRFLDEGRLSSQLSHPNVVAVYDFGLEDDEYFLVLEHIRGLDLGSLREALAEHALNHPPAPLSADMPSWERELHEWHAYFQRGVLPPVFVAWLGMKAASALAYVHTAEIRDGDRVILGLVHRDISDCNIMLDCHGRLVVMDLGIAKAMTDGSKASATDTAWGKLAYSPAEQFSGQEIDPSADLYALGITLFILVAAAHPFDDRLAPPNEHPFNRAGRMARDQRAPMRVLLPDVPAALSDILEGLVQAKVENRTPRKAAELVERFHEAITSLGSDLHRLEKQAAALVSRVYVDRDKDRTQEDPIPRKAVEASHERPVSKVTAADTPAALARQPAPDNVIDRTPPTMDLAPRSSRSRLWALIGAASLVLAALVAAGIVGFVAAAGSDPPSVTPQASHGQPTLERADTTEAFTGRFPDDAIPSPPAPLASTDVHALVPPGPAELPGDAPPSMADGAPPAPSDSAPGSSEPGPNRTSDSVDTAPRGTLVLTAAPLGELFVDGRRVGTNSARVRVRPGTHRIGVGPRGAHAPTRTETVHVSGGTTVQRILHP